MAFYTMITIAILAVVLLLLLFVKIQLATRDVGYLRAIVNNQRDYTFLLDKDLCVKQTNYYAHGNKKVNGEPNILGNVLHCKNAHESGRCGEAEDCHTCPLRFVIGKSLERHESFSGIEACLEIQDEDDKIVDIDVLVDGHYVELNKKSHMVINVKDITNNKDLKPKILFVSENISIIDNVIKSLGGEYRILAADNLHQVMLRLMNLDSYRFCAFVTDESFYKNNDTVLKMLVKNRQLPVFVFTSNIDASDDGSVHYLPENIAADELFQRFSAFSSCFC